MNKFYIQTQNVTSIITGTTMFIDGDKLYVYNGEELKGIYRTESIIVAYRTDK